MDSGHLCFWGAQLETQWALGFLVFVSSESPEHKEIQPKSMGAAGHSIPLEIGPHVSPDGLPKNRGWQNQRPLLKMWVLLFTSRTRETASE